MEGRLWNRFARIDTALSVGEWGWRIFSFLSVGGGAVFAAWLAKADPFLSQLGSIYWFAISIIAALSIAFIFWLIKDSVAKQALASYYRSLAVPKSLVNPLQETFDGLIIPVEDLRLPGLIVHENKHFRNCKFVGPGAIAIFGGSYSNSSFNNAGDILSFPPDAQIAGIVVFAGCTVERCEFVRVTILADHNTGRGFKNAGMPVKGIPE